ncbi:Sua5/YciO/YrdC/YwlC family protein [Halobacteroides halobius DSM 5150]|uniref:Threonylcarbamoyl-AMP synthase n=1 Tax=Halobacteroides halobius (strain ATCC 35273 / DSM 5150 / MD-1) TaxID=748449 RepID=L0KCT8_HALHC|nr:L-threonylcarbamoyladenylate synthase [Halobacteroides halobius]AGB42350.1 Sua5/YciO/YrdC/YwlC family protein [Halobacteroides halobius DSM 5150]
MKEIKETKVFSQSEVQEAAKLLQEGRLVAFPTETVYGLGANALDPQAVEKIFAAKGRPADNPLIVHIANQNKLEELISSELSKQAQKLIDEFWPGPLTLVLPKASKVPKITTGGLETVAVRMPKHPLAQQLIEEAQVPLAAPSANLSGRPSPTIAQHVMTDLAGRISGVVDGGQTGIGVESTVLDLSQGVPTLLRPGGVTYEQLKETLKRVIIDPAVEAKIDNEAQQALSPGMKYKHYAPEAKVVLIEGAQTEIVAKIKELIRGEEGKIGVMATTESSHQYQNAIVKEMGSRNNLKQISMSIFKLLREFDQLGVDKIFIEGLSQSGLGLAIMNRLRKAAGYNIIKV